jgi:hypothetical protein
MSHSTTIIPGCKMGAKVERTAGDIRVEKTWTAVDGGDGSLDLFCCSHADVFSCTPYDDLSKQELDGHIVTLCARCELKAMRGARVVDKESGCVLEVQAMIGEEPPAKKRGPRHPKVWKGTPLPFDEPKVGA